MLEVFQRARGERSGEIPEQLRCGDDLRPQPEPEELGAAAEPAVGLPVALLAAEEAIRNWVVATFHSLFRPCRPEETTALSLGIVRATIQGAGGAPTWLQ